MWQILESEALAHDGEPGAVDAEDRIIYLANLEDKHTLVHEAVLAALMETGLFDRIGSEEAHRVARITADIVLL